MTDTQKSLLILGVGGVVAIACGGLIYLDLGARDEVLKEIEAQQAVVAKNKSEIEKIPGLKKELVAYKKIVSDNARILPTDDDINNFIRDLANLEKDAGISIRMMPVYVPAPDRKVPLISRIPMKLTLNASTRSYLRFLNQLENRERLVTVTEFRISPANEEPKPGQDLEHDVSMAFDLYRYDPKAGQQGKFPVRSDEELQLLETKEVKDIVAAKAKPAGLERYQLLPGRDNRRDPFVDPRRSTGTTKGPGGGDTIREEEERRLEALKLRLEKCLLEGDSFRSAEQAKDFLRMAASKRNFIKAKEELEEDLRKVSANNPEFKSRDLQDRYLVEVKRPYEKLMIDFADLIGGSGTRDGYTLTEGAAAGLRKGLQESVDNRKFREAAEQWGGIDALVRDAGRNVEEGAKPHVEAMRVIGEHARYQAMLAEKKIEVQGLVRMERTSAAIINGRTLFPGKNLDKDTVFLRVEEGSKGEPDRLIFKIQGHEVDHIQPKPQTLGSEKAILTQD